MYGARTTVGAVTGEIGATGSRQTLTAPSWWRTATACAAVVFVGGALWRVVGHVSGTYAADVPGVVGTVVLLLLALVTGFGAVAAWANRYVVDDHEVVQQLGRHRRSVPLTGGTEVTLRRESRGGPTGFGHLFVLRLTRPGSLPVMADQAWVAQFEVLLEAVARAGQRHPSLLADPTLRAVLRDPDLLEGSRAEVDLAVDDERPADDEGR